MTDGCIREVLTYNDTVPGPVIRVCEGDTVHVTLLNNIKDGPVTNSDGSPNTTTLHFHGIREFGDKNSKVFGPWSDGVPYVTQCPLEPDSDSEDAPFVYKFYAGKGSHFNAPPGTYWYHSHIGAQRTNGLQGGVIIRDSGTTQQQIEADHLVVLQEWYKSPTIQVPVSILVNGQGRLSDKIHDFDPDEVNKYLRGFGGNFPKVDYKKGEGERCGDLTTNYAVFKTTSGPNRFRIVGLIGQNFPIRVSVHDADNKLVPFTVIATDSLYVEPVEKVDYLWVAAGERYDISLDNVPPLTTETICCLPAYKMRMIGFTDLSNTTGTPLCTIAYLTNDQSPTIDQSYVVPHDCKDFDLTIVPDNARVLNPPAKHFTNFSNRVQFPDWKNSPDLKGPIYPVDLRSIFENETRPFNEGNSKLIEFNPSTTFNGIRTTYRDVPYFLQSAKDVVDHPRCDENNAANFYNYKTDDLTTYFCPHVVKFPLNPTWGEAGHPAPWAQIILINSNSYGASHPIHQHGGWYWVVGEGQFNSSRYDSINSSYIKNLAENGILFQTSQTEDYSISWVDTDNATPKDVIQVPNLGYVIIRTKLDNPGNWIFHCHIDFHLSLGMGMGEMKMECVNTFVNSILVLALQIGEEQGLGNRGPLTDLVGKECSEKSPDPRGGKMCILQKSQ